MSEALQKWGGGDVQPASEVPDFLRQSDAKGYEEVKSPIAPSVYRLSQALSDVVTDKKMDSGVFYESSDKESLGSERVICIFRTRWVRQLMNPQGKSIACKAYSLDDKGFGVGTIRLFNKDDMPKNYINLWGLTDDELNNPQIRVREQDCTTCPFAQWTVSDEGRNVPPECKRVYELYFLDVTDLPSGGIDRIPHRFDMVESNAAVRAAIRDLDNQIIRRLRQSRVPIWGGFFRMSAEVAENERGAKFYAPKFEFLRLMNAEEAPIAELAEILFDEISRRQDEVDRLDQQSTGSADDAPAASAPVMEEQSEGDLGSTPWD